MYKHKCKICHSKPLLVAGKIGERRMQKAFKYSGARMKRAIR